MKYIIVTHIDSFTKVPCFEQDMWNGPAFPEVKGLKIEWWDESNWPLTHPDQYPRFYGTCDDDADLTVPGVMGEIHPQNYQELWQFELKARLPSVVSPRQFRLALLEMNLLSALETYVESLEEPLKTKLKIEWEYATEIDKHAPSIQKLYTKLGITEQQLDDLFVLASTIELTDPEPEPENESEESEE